MFMTMREEKVEKKPIVSSTSGHLELVFCLIWKGKAQKQNVLLVSFLEGSGRRPRHGGPGYRCFTSAVWLVAR